MWGPAVPVPPQATTWLQDPAHTFTLVLNHATCSLQTHKPGEMPPLLPFLRERCSDDSHLHAAVAGAAQLDAWWCGATRQPPAFEDAPLTAHAVAQLDEGTLGEVSHAVLPLAVAHAYRLSDLMQGESEEGLLPARVPARAWAGGSCVRQWHQTLVLSLSLSCAACTQRGAHSVRPQRPHMCADRLA